MSNIPTRKPSAEKPSTKHHWNYYGCHIGDFAKDLPHLSDLEIWVYYLLMDRYYATGQAIPSVDVYSIACAFEVVEKAAVDAVLAEFFCLENGFWRKIGAGRGK